MNTGTDHIAISLRDHKKDSLNLGRAKDNECMLYEPRHIGRSVKQKRELVRSYVKGIDKFFGVEKKNQYITFTSHNGKDFHLYVS